MNFGCQVGDKRHHVDLRVFISSNLTGHLENESDLEDATEMLFRKSGGYFVYMASMVANFQGERKWKMVELEKLPEGLDGKYCDYFARILEPKQTTVPYDVSKVRSGIVA